MAPPRPDAAVSDSLEPFGWQVSLRWNLLEIADGLLPLDAQDPRIYASDCPAFFDVDDEPFRLAPARFDVLADAQEVVE